MITRLARDEGMTVFLSSHMLGEVEQICTSMAVLREGQLLVVGQVDQILSAESASLTELQAEPMDGAKTILESLANVTSVVAHQQHLRFRVDHKHRPQVIQVLTEQGIRVFSLAPVSSLEDYFLSLFENKEIS